MTSRSARFPLHTQVLMLPCTDHLVDGSPLSDVLPCLLILPVWTRLRREHQLQRLIRSNHLQLLTHLPLQSRRQRHQRHLPRSPLLNYLLPRTHLLPQQAATRHRPPRRKSPLQPRLRALHQPSRLPPLLINRHRQIAIPAAGLPK